MKVLAVEASGNEMAMCALQCSQNSEVRAQLQRNETRAMSRDLMANLDETLSRAGWKIGDVEALCVGLGPGSWTSLRIVLSMMKTLAQTREIPLSGIATFEAAAQAVLANANAQNATTHASDATNADVTEADAKNGNATNTQSADLPARFALLMLAPSRAGELYARLFWVQSGALETLHTENVGSPQEIAARVLATLCVLDASAPLLLCNLENASRDCCEVGETLSQNLELRQVRVSFAQIATQIARLGAEKIRDGKADNALSLLPIYVAPSAAERLREKNLEAAAASTREALEIAAE